MNKQICANNILEQQVSSPQRDPNIQLIYNTQQYTTILLTSTRSFPSSSLYTASKTDSRPGIVWSEIKNLDHPLKSFYPSLLQSRMGAPLRAALWGEVGFPPRKNEQNRGEAPGKIKARISNLSNIRNQWWNNITILQYYNILVDDHWEKVKSESTLNSILFFC